MKSWKEKIARIITEEVENRRRMGIEVSESHSLSHLGNVAELTQEVGFLYDYTECELRLVYAAGWGHDIKRRPTEDPAAGDKEASADETRRLLTEAGLVVEEEGEAIAYAIIKQSHYPEWLSSPQTRERLPETLKEKLHFALFVADKIEQNGVRAIARGFQFVAGNQLRSETGGWRSFGFQPDKDEVLVVVIEALLRLAFINPEEIYPARLSPLVKPLYQALREAILGGFRVSGLRVEDVARLLLESKTSDGRNILQLRRISAPKNLIDLVGLIAAKSGINDQEISSVSEDLASSALEAVEYFGHHYEEDLDDLVFGWSPAGEKAREWQGMMRGKMVRLKADLS